MKHTETTWHKELFYSQYQPNTTQTWCKMDTEERYKSTCRSFNKKGDEFYWKPESVSYTFNEYGFRGPSPKSNAPFKILVSGCSYTMGIGIPYDMTWPHLLSKQIPNSIEINLGVGGRSGDYVVRSIYKTIDVIKPNLVAVLWPPTDRFDIVENGKVRTQTAQDHDYPRLFADDHLLDFYQNRNSAFLYEICNRASVPLICLNSYDHYDVAKILKISPEEVEVKARDYAHPGPAWQRCIAHLMYEQFQQLHK